MDKKSKTKFILFSIVILVIGFISGLATGNTINNSSNADIYEINIKNDSNCNKKAILYYEGKERNIYTYCLKSVEVNQTELKDLLKEDEKSIDEIILELGKSEGFWDGGSELYKDGGSVRFTGEKMNLLKCQTIDGNKDIYIGNSEMGYETGFCERKVTLKEETFIKTYQVLHIAPSNDDAYVYITLRQYQAEEVDTVRVKTAVFNEYEVGKNYEFTFQKIGLDIENNTQSIFNNTRLIKVEETDKLGLEQINENI